MSYSEETIDFANKVVYRLLEILKECPNVDEKYRCWTMEEKKHTRCKDLTWLLAEITNLPEYLDFLKKNAKADAYGWIIEYPKPSEPISKTTEKKLT